MALRLRFVVNIRINFRVSLVPELDKTGSFNTYRGNKLWVKHGVKKLFYAFSHACQETPFSTFRRNSSHCEPSDNTQFIRLD